MSEKILIVDDEIDICLLLNKFLSKKGYKVEEAYTGKKALSLIEKNDYNLVICDFRLPDMDGTESIKQIKALKPQIKIVIITGYSDVKTAVQCIKLGAFEYVTKPIYPEEILLSVKNALESKNSDTQVNDTESKVKSSFNETQEYLQGISPQSKRLEQIINLLAPTDMSVIIQGESGTGKEFVANSIHSKSKRGKKPFVAIDCGALPKELAGSELFGHIKGSFTGAINNKTGHFEFANGGTIFLDEIGNLTYENQIKLLRVLQERKVKKIGDTKDVKIDVRVIAASNEDLSEAVKKGRFREDLFYRLNEFMIDISPLRERREDVMLFAEHFLNQANDYLGKDIQGFEKDAIDRLTFHYWPGNLRELKNVIKRAVLLCQENKINLQSLPTEITSPSLNDNYYTEEDDSNIADLKSVAELAERKAILKVLEQTGYNKTKAANVLKIDRKTLYNKMESYDINFKR